MRYKGHNILAIVVAAIVIYLIEFLIFAVAIPADQYIAMTGITAEQADASRMPVGALMPILAAIGLSLVIKWRAAPGPFANAYTGLLMGVLFAFSGSLYAYVYGAHTQEFVAINLAHFVICYGAAGAIIGAWK
jgi:hypothetical protein